MPKRSDIKKVLIIGSGPIIIGQACEFDYSGTQACKALREEGYRIVLVNSNPATIMTDPDVADRTYVEPLTPDVVAGILEHERPDALLPTVGGQTGLNLAVELDRRGLLERLGVRMIGVSPEAVEICENRERFRAAVESVGLSMPGGGFATTLDQAQTIQSGAGRSPQGSPRTICCTNAQVARPKTSRATPHIHHWVTVCSSRKGGDEFVSVAMRASERQRGAGFNAESNSGARLGSSIRYPTHFRHLTTEPCQVRYGTRPVSEVS